MMNLKSIPARIGKKGALRISRILHLLASGLVILAGVTGKFGLFYWIGSAAFIGLLIFQHTLVKPNNLSRVNLAFFTTNGFASVIFAVFVILDLYL